MSPIDSQDKRTGVAGGENPLPDGSIDAGDRATIAHEYVPGLYVTSILGGLSTNIFGDDMGYTFKK